MDIGCTGLGLFEKQAGITFPVAQSLLLDTHVWMLRSRPTHLAIQPKLDGVYHSCNALFCILLIISVIIYSWFFVVVLSLSCYNRKNSGNGRLRSITLTDLCSTDLYQECLSLSDTLEKQWSLDLNCSAKPWVASPSGRPSIADFVAFILDIPDRERLSQEQKDIKDAKMAFRSMALSLVAQVGELCHI